MPRSAPSTGRKPSWTGPPTTRAKKRLTRKNTLIADSNRSIHYLGPTTCGSTHDYQLLKNEFDVNLGLLDLFDLLADLGYLGLVTDYNLPPQSLPHRKPHRSKKRPNAALNDAQRAENAAHARRRVKVEHAISGAKRLGCVAQTCRNKSAAFNDRLMALAYGIWNWHLVKQKEVI
ncbi:MAG: transposase family protein [Janthinobacterium lividum]